MSLGPIFEAALEAQSVCLAIKLPHCAIGGLAVQRWGEPRFTADADFSVLVQQGAESAAIQGLLKQLSARIEDAEEFAIRTRVVLLKSGDDIGIDVVLAGLPYEARVIERSSLWAMDEAHSLRTCSAEDLVIMKVFAARDKDWADVTSILERQGGNLDLDLIREELKPLLAAKEADHLGQQLEARIQKHIPKPGPRLE
ncbi:MAG: nucleotidyl transferase AbiEii/AbiGii toxin family protein [Xanthomonadales bacterium]|nr:nucleotidyl transferase AbiEii/AbiGii toxin family protein [Xanthomonadales bacterium]